MTIDFKPPYWLQGANRQTLLPRFSFNRVRAIGQQFLFDKLSYECIIPANGKTGEFTNSNNEFDGVRLHGSYTPQIQLNAPLFIMIHGWEGRAESIYMLSACERLYRAGFAIFRLHLRDHGPSHHLNRQLFNAARLGEVLDALSYLQQQFPASQYLLAGFSMGGGFALRIAAYAHMAGLDFAKIFAICPLINPEQAAEAIMQQPIYHRFFVKKWQRSLALKHKLFDNLIDPILLTSDNYQVMTDHFVEQHTPFTHTLNYYQQYTIDQTLINKIHIPTFAFLAQDDPILPIASAQNLINTDYVTFYRTSSGGHCGYHENIFGQSWIDKQLVLLAKE